MFKQKKKFQQEPSTYSTNSAENFKINNLTHVQKTVSDVHLKEKQRYKQAYTNFSFTVSSQTSFSYMIDEEILKELEVKKKLQQDISYTNTNSERSGNWKHGYITMFYNPQDNSQKEDVYIKHGCILLSTIYSFNVLWSHCILPPSHQYNERMGVLGKGEFSNNKIKNYTLS